MFEFFRARLSRVIFMWFAVTIVAVVVLFWVVGGLFLYLGEGTTRWDQEMQRIARHLSTDLEPHWDDDDARAAWVEKFAADLEVEARVVAADGAVLEQTDEWDECMGHQQAMPITRAGERLGTLEVRNPRGAPIGRALFVLVLIGLALMVASGIVARRLGRPLRGLSEAARDFGGGDLTRRAEVTGTGELREVATEFNEMAERITDQIEGHKSLLAEVSHELRTPLGHLRLLVEIIRDAGPTEARLNKLELEIEAMDDLVDQLLAGARLDFDLERAEPVNLIDVAVMAAERVGKPEVLDVSDGVASAVVRGDATLLTRALSNLVQNAEQHGDGVTRLAVFLLPESVVFQVEDRGPGITDADAAFTAFQKGNGSDDGLGLGLSLVRRIASAHGGRVELGPGSGANIRLVLPRATIAESS